MKKVYFLLLLLAVGCGGVNKLYNDFGTFKKAKCSDDSSVIRIYLDRFGDIYPDFLIDHDTFAQHYSALEKVYKRENAIFERSLRQENITPSVDKEADRKLLEETLAEKYARIINRNGTGKTTVLLIHGYNNTPFKANANFEIAENKTRKKLNSDNILFVEIYWDGLNHGNSPINSAKIWNNAQVSASFAGLGLRRILNKLTVPKAYVITHSHGAAVITEALFNVKRFGNKYYSNNSAGQEIDRFQDFYPTYKTPSIEFRVGMLAPAIPGVNVFSDYRDRTTENGNVAVDLYNYKFISGYNIHDVATTKWKFAAQFGSTTLGCRLEENRSVEGIFSGQPEVFSKVNFSNTTDGVAQYSHAFPSYMANPQFEIFMDNLFKL